jgi:ADP-ribosylglycohydrolase
LLAGDARLYARRAPGNTCLSALAASFMGRPMPSVATPPNDSKGCGAVMRAAPHGLAATTREQAFREARDGAVLTHGHPSGYLSAAYFAALIFDLARDLPLAQAMLAADELLGGERGAEELQQILGKARELAARGAASVDSLESLGGGWTGEEALAIALCCALSCAGVAQEHVAESLWRAVAHGGDSDSTGSLTGNLLGATLGMGALPTHWLKQLELADLIERLAVDLWSACFEDAQIDHADYPAG